MKPLQQIRSHVPSVVAYLYVLLFVYAAASKLTDFEKFQLEVSQSPLLTAYAGLFAYLTIFSELFIAILLTLPRLRAFAIYAAFTLMVLFSVYIFIILHYSPYIPCSCGGILQKMGWEQHLVFNLVFAGLGIIAAYLIALPHKRLRTTVTLLVLTTAAIGFMVLLFVFSEHTLHHRNNFVRRFPPFTASKTHETDLKYSGYYFAGVSESNVYLGNYYTPSVVTVLDTTLKHSSSFRIQLDDTLNFKSVQIKVRPPYFYVYDGSVPCIYSGRISDWKAKLRMKDLQRFSVIEPLDSASVAFRSATVRYGNLLGKFDFGSRKPVVYKKGLLQKQIDGVFDTDGTMQYSMHSKKFVYLYYYRNEYVVTDANLNLVHRGHTIDTTTKAQIDVAYLEQTRQTKFASPPLLVNRKSTLHNNLLFVNAMLPGKYEPLVMWKKASIIDVYDIEDRSYVFSFYITNMDQKKLSGFVATATHLFVLFESKIVVYRFEQLLKKAYNQPN